MPGGAGKTCWLPACQDSTCVAGATCGDLAVAQVQNLRQAQQQQIVVGGLDVVQVELRSTTFGQRM